MSRAVWFGFFYAQKQFKKKYTIIKNWYGFLYYICIRLKLIIQQLNLLSDEQFQKFNTASK